MKEEVKPVAYYCKVCKRAVYIGEYPEERKELLICAECILKWKIEAMTLLGFKKKGE